MLLTKVKTAWALGPTSLARVLAYRAGVRLGLNPVRRLKASIPTGPFFGSYTGPVAEDNSFDAWSKHAQYFGWFNVPLNGKCPDWHTNPFIGIRSRFADKPWWLVPDFDPELGDIKTVWEASRWDWVLQFAVRARTRDAHAITQLNEWLSDWCRSNPPYLGANWKCGQEASIRVMHLAMAAAILDQWKSPLPGLVALLRMHLQRITPTISYAVAQNNNHGTSEAAALFIGGTWLDRIDGDQTGGQMAKLGRRWLENRVGALVEVDGSFSQYSVNYHRVLLDTLSMVEVWRRKLALSPLSELFMSRARAATDWLDSFTELSTGDTPNIGANDGARLLPISRTSYRDYRPSVQLASALFAGTSIYPDGPLNDSLKCLEIPVPATRPLQIRKSHIFDDGGYAVLRLGTAHVYMRYPRFRFRPAHADALHVDLWLGPRNILRDGGSYSYADDRWNSHFCGTGCQNTIQFDGRDQMPRLGRFLFGDWLKSQSVGRIDESAGQTSFAASYRDWQSAYHLRELTLSAGELRVVDRVQGFRDSAVLRWRLEPGSWRLDGTMLSSAGIRLQVKANVAISRIALVQAQESRFYMKMNEIPVLEVEIREAGNIETMVIWT